MIYQAPLALLDFTKWQGYFQAVNPHAPCSYGMQPKKSGGENQVIINNSCSRVVFPNNIQRFVGVFFPQNPESNETLMIYLQDKKKNPHTSLWGSLFCPSHARSSSQSIWQRFHCCLLLKFSDQNQSKMIVISFAHISLLVWCKALPSKNMGMFCPVEVNIKI